MGSVNEFTKLAAIQNMLSDHKKPATVEGISEIANPAATGIWKKGKVDSDQLQKLLALAIEDRGQRILLRCHVEAFLAEQRAGQKESLGNATHIFLGTMAVPWEKVTKCSFDDLFLCFSNHLYKTEQALTVDHMSLFYTNPEEFFATATLHHKKTT